MIGFSYYDQLRQLFDRAQQDDPKLVGLVDHNGILNVNLWAYAVESFLDTVDSSKEEWFPHLLSYLDEGCRFDECFSEDKFSFERSSRERGIVSEEKESLISVGRELQNKFSSLFYDLSDTGEKVQVKDSLLLSRVKKYEEKLTDLQSFMSKQAVSFLKEENIKYNNRYVDFGIDKSVFEQELKQGPDNIKFFKLATELKENSDEATLLEDDNLILTDLFKNMIPNFYRVAERFGHGDIEVYFHSPRWFDADCYVISDNDGVAVHGELLFDVSIYFREESLDHRIKLGQFSIRDPKYANLVRVVLLRTKGTNGAPVSVTAIKDYFEAFLIDKAALRNHIVREMPPSIRQGERLDNRWRLLRDGHGYKNLYMPRVNGACVDVLDANHSNYYENVALTKMRPLDEGMNAQQHNVFVQDKSNSVADILKNAHWMQVNIVENVEYFDKRDHAVIALIHEKNNLYVKDLQNNFLKYVQSLLEPTKSSEGEYFSANHMNQAKLELIDLLNEVKEQKNILQAFLYLGLYKSMKTNENLKSFFDPVLSVGLIDQGIFESIKEPVEMLNIKKTGMKRLEDLKVLLLGQENEVGLLEKEIHVDQTPPLLSETLARLRRWREIFTEMRAQVSMSDRNEISNEAH